MSACTLRTGTMEMHEVHPESRDIFDISLATGTEAQIPDCPGETEAVGMYVTHWLVYLQDEKKCKRCLFLSLISENLLRY